MSTTRIEIDARGVATLWLARPEKHNALSAQLIDEIHGAIERLGADPAVRVVVLAGEGRSFCAGGDLGWMQEQMAADGETRASEAWRLAEMLGAINACPKPVVGRIHGNAFGGGVGMACVCDVAVAVEGASFGFTETRLGLIPATIGPYVLARMGEAMARRVFMSARIFDAAEALRLGVVARTVPEAELDAAVEAEVAPYLACAPGAVAEAKALSLKLGAAPSDAEVEASVEALVTRWESPEAGEGIAAFFAKRKAAWMA
ncbi:MAG: crotonase/enoyl-CoA hydratase family protein [Vannielia sp.]|uniref:crotonase/enoyl-CoA hydratase family protein n=1 Tax=Vannielia sp. TaxID=2813045 RepID=UPI003B8CECB9